MRIIDGGNNARLIRPKPWMISAGRGFSALLDLFSGGILQGAGTLTATTILGVP